MSGISTIYIREQITTEQDAIRVVINTESAAAADSINEIDSITYTSI